MFYNNIRTLEIESSSICNAACPQCQREDFPGDYSRFQQTYLSEKFFEDRIPQTVYDNLDYVLLSGTLGDPCAAPNFLKVLSAIRQRAPKAIITVATNGGMKTPKFWTEIAKILRPNDTVVFGIDGLEDTNHIYRVNVRWNKLIKNVRAFIDAGGRAAWQFIVFKHNETQVDAARVFSEQLGFKEFRVKKTHRFFLEDAVGVVRYGGDGKILEPPSDTEYKNIIFFKKDFKKLDVNSWMSSVNNSNISCAAQRDQSVFIDHLGRIFPCCFVAASLYSRARFEPLNDGWTSIWNGEGGDKINLHFNDWSSIINSKFYDLIQDSWTEKFPNRLITCAGTCSDSDSKFNNIKDDQKKSIA